MSDLSMSTRHAALSRLLHRPLSWAAWREESRPCMVSALSTARRLRLSLSGHYWGRPADICGLDY
jgi:hypothetical protein